MTTLTHTAYYARRIITFCGIIFVGLVVARISLTASQNIWEKIKPPPPEQATVGFGKLPKLEFPERKNIPELKIKLETVDGNLPVFDQKLIKVYFMPHQSLGLLSYDRAKNLAERMGFKQEPETQDNINFTWSTESEPPAILEMNINDNNFYLRFHYEQDPTLSFQRVIANDQQAIDIARSWLRRFGFLHEDLQNARAEVKYYRYSPPNLIPVFSISETSFFKVNQFRENIEDMRIMPPDPQEPLISVLIAEPTRQAAGGLAKNIMEVKYTYYQFDQDSFATYPLKPVNQAWRELENQKGFIANLGKNQDGQIIIRKIYLGYYDSKEPQNFLQPIYVFEGDRDFMAYVTAIDDIHRE